MSAKKPVIALLYDFDKTLCTKDMQEYSFIPGSLGIKPADFWAEANRRAREEEMDQILAYMYTMIRQAQSKDVPIHREDFVKMGAAIEFYPGVPEWFARINEYGKLQGAAIEHYIISSGLKEFIEGSVIAKEFKEIYACAFHYNKSSGAADWPASAVNYTGKTQFLFRINKGVLDISDDKSVNEYVPEEARPVPFRNMIYIGDGVTDVPCMRLVKQYGGQSFAVYARGKKAVAQDLLRDGRVQYIAPADYQEGNALDEMVKRCLDKMCAENVLVEKRCALAKQRAGSEK